MPSAWDPLRLPDFRRLFVATFFTTIASRAMAVVLGYRVYELTHSPLSVGMLGLVEAIPSLGLALYGGHIADRRDRRAILKWGLLVLTAAAAALSFSARLESERWQLIAMYVTVFLAGIARGFAEPAVGAFEAQLVPWEWMVRSSVLMATCWLTAAAIGPLLGGVSLDHFGPTITFAGISVLFAVGWVAVYRIAPRPPPQPQVGETVWQSVAIGVRYVWRDQVILGSMALDLFAVLFGGVIAMLPVFAKDILHVGPNGLGALNAAPTLGALLTMLWCTRKPPVKHAGRTLLIAVAGFGVTMIVFALSASFWLSLLALFFSGVMDGVSVVIRRAILRLMSPEHLRGRIAAVSMIFIGSSNELGAMESGLAAAAVGTVPSVWAGGLVTLVVVALATMFAPKLRRLSLDQQQARNCDDEVDALAGDAHKRSGED